MAGGDTEKVNRVPDDRKRLGDRGAFDLIVSPSMDIGPFNKARCFMQKGTKGGWS